MDNILEFELTSDDPAEINKLLDRYIEALTRIHEQVEKDQAEIDRLSAETWALLAQMRKAA